MCDRRDDDGSRHVYCLNGETLHVETALGTLVVRAVDAGTQCLVNWEFEEVNQGIQRRKYLKGAIEGKGRWIPRWSWVRYPLGDFHHNYKAKNFRKDVPERRGRW